jgi:hypothetical protein
LTVKKNQVSCIFEKMTKVATVDLIVYGVLGVLIVLTLSYHKRIRNAKEDNYLWSSAIMTWLAALFVAGLFVGGKYAFQQMGKSQALADIDNELRQIPVATLNPV